VEKKVIPDQTAALLGRWQQGDQQAAAELFRSYATRLAALVRKRMTGKFAQRVDPEDIVQSACRSFFVSAKAGRFDVQNGGDLWRLLVAITLHKVYRRVQQGKTAKRDLSREQNFGSEDSLQGLQRDLFGRDPSPEEAAAVADQLVELMQRLEPIERRVLEFRLQGCTAEEIAAEVGCSVRTVRYALSEIKRQLEQGYDTLSGS
jgi:RNA polymerase sigma-70 factor (ECF subfamily)